MIRYRIGRKHSDPPDTSAAEWLNLVRAYAHEDWLTTGIVEYLEARSKAGTASQPTPCLGCGHRFPRGDLWVHHRFHDIAYCDGCYYRRFGRHSA